MVSIEERLKARAHELGFDLVGIAPAAPADDFAHLQSWLEAGYAGTMEYMHRHANARRDLTAVLPEVRSVVMVAMNYFCEETATEADLSRITGTVARYARGSDYHDVLRERLNQLLAWFQNEVPGSVGRGVVDTAPLLERDFARRAGLGWIGKNTMLLNKRLGSYFFLGALLVDQELITDEPHVMKHCGTCTACLTACPTGAFVQPGQLDARRCISYLTIELKSSIPNEWREAIGEWVFGCDICQEVCPWNRHPTFGDESLFQPRADLEALDLLQVMRLTEEEFRRRFHGTALMRTKRRGLLRNTAIVLGNRGDPAALPVLQSALTDPEPVIREAAEWAIQRITEKVKKLSNT